MNYYNEFDPAAAQWLRNLIAAGLIPPGEVDERSITEVQPHELAGYIQCHFFAGIGGWPLALQLAAWSSDRPVWTGSCPCQPFSVAGKGKGTEDERHLWPEFLRLIAQCKPATVFGEQVASAAGREWLAGVRADLETLAYAVGAADLCAAGVGAPHIRQRLYWVADSHSQSSRQGSSLIGGWDTRGNAESWSGLGGSGDDSGLGDTERPRLEGYAGHVNNGGEPGRVEPYATGSAATSGRHSWGDNRINCADGKARRIEPGISPLAHGVPARVVKLRGYGNAINPQITAEFIIAAMQAVNDNTPQDHNV
jgi:DNA (cytosine-5)-methyltransferase 1